MVYSVLKYYFYENSVLQKNLAIFNITGNKTLNFEVFIRQTRMLISLYRSSNLKQNLVYFAL